MCRNCLEFEIPDKELQKFIANYISHVLNTCTLYLIPILRLLLNF